MFLRIHRCMSLNFGVCLPGMGDRFQVLLRGCIPFDVVGYHVNRFESIDRHIDVSFGSCHFKKNCLFCGPPLMGPGTVAGVVSWSVVTDKDIDFCRQVL